MKWRVVEIEARAAAFNMALDDAVVEHIARGESPPTIRFYRWSPSAVSIGYFQSLHDEVSVEKCRELGVDVVRRITGGGAVYHDFDGEITYSVIAPEQLLPKGITESYHVICGWITNSLAKLGINAEFKPINDVIINGKKVSGNAQTRRQGVLLQHGTILYDLDVRKMFSLLKVGQEKISDKFIQSVEERVTRVKDHCSAGFEEVYAALVDGFTEGKETEFDSWSESEFARASELFAKYASEEWINKR